MIVASETQSPARTAALETTTQVTALPPAIETDNLRKVYDRRIAVHGLTIRVEQGEVFGFLGPNGAGKTTTVKMLMGLVHPTAGTARLLGKPLGDRDAKRKVGFLPELFRFHDWLTGEEFLDFHGRLYRMSAAERRKRIPEVLELVGLAGRGGEKLRGYSKGMQQRAGLAQALLNNPQVVFLDEPTSALDPLGRMDVRDVIRRLRDQGTTVFLNSHLLSEVETVCDRVAIINHGQLAAVGPVLDLLDRAFAVELRLGAWNADIEAAISRTGRILELDHPTPRHSIATIEAADEERIAALVDRLVALGTPVYGVTPRRLSLEDVFLTIVGGQRLQQPALNPHQLERPSANGRTPDAVKSDLLTRTDSERER
ncbi:MAG: ABC transporter [Chloroflexi bacterium]|nr:MAG: ABC transporter [Chloroflexota bacterium]